MQPIGSLSLSGDFSAHGFSADLPILVDTGIDDMILWVSPNHAQPNLPSHSAFPTGITASISAPPADLVTEPVLQYSFITGDTSQPMAPSKIEWRIGKGGQHWERMFWRAPTIFMTRLADALGKLRT